MVDRSLAITNLKIPAIGPRKDMASERAVMDTAPNDDMDMRMRSAPGTIRAPAVEAAMMRNILTGTTDTTATTAIITMDRLVRIRIRAVPRIQCRARYRSCHNE
jgi:hypothetical protein